MDTVRTIMRARFRVLVSRSATQGSALAECLEANGAEAVLVPAIELAPPPSFVELDAAIGQLANFDWLLFTSANAVTAFAERRKLLSDEVDVSGTPPIERQPRVAAIGAATATAAAGIGFCVALVPAQAVAESLAAALLPHALQADSSPTRFLLVRAAEAREHLPDTLRAAGAEVLVAPAYRTVIPPSSVAAIRALFAPQSIETAPTSGAPCPNPQSPGSSDVRGIATILGAPGPDLRTWVSSEPNGGHVSRIDAITFTSSSTARNLFALFEAAGVPFPTDAARVSIGPITSATLRDLRYPPHAEAPVATVASLAETVVKYLAAAGRR